MWNIFLLGVHRLRRISILTALLGLLTLIISLFMTAAFPSNREMTNGFSSPILAFEFASQEKDIDFLLGDSEEAASLRNQMDTGHLWDMVFLFAYAGLFAAYMYQELDNGGLPARFGLGLALLIIPADIHENLVLMEITGVLEAGGEAEKISPLLQVLPLATWLKWGLIGIVSLLFSLVFYKKKNWLSSVLSLIAGLSVIVVWFSSSEPVWVERMSGVLALFFVFLVIRAFFVCGKEWVHAKKQPS